MPKTAVLGLSSLLLACGVTALASLTPREMKSCQAQAQAEQLLERGISVARLVRGNPARKEIALTFDDGPHGYRTEQLLDLLKRENVKATFFVVGKMVDKYPDLVRRAAAEGHEIGNHTYDHLRLPGLPPALVEAELREGDAAITRAIGSSVRLYRPPGGEYDQQVVEAAGRLGDVMVLWTDDPGDFTQPGAIVIEQRALRSIEPGAILLLHDGIAQTLQILPDLIHNLRQQGYRFVTVSGMARQPGAITTGGPHVPRKTEEEAYRPVGVPVPR